MPPPQGLPSGSRRFRATDSSPLSEFDQAVKAQAHHLLRQGDRRLEELGCLGPDHPEDTAPRAPVPAAGQPTATTTPGSDGDTAPDR